MNRVPLIDRIISHLAWLEVYLKRNSTQNFGTSAVILEDVCVPLLNLCYALNLRNLNAPGFNAVAGDLLCADSGRAFQITISATTKKVGEVHAKAGSLAADVSRLTIFFVVGLKGAKNVPDPSKNFTPCTAPVIDKLDIDDLITHIRGLSVILQEEIATLLDAECLPRRAAEAAAGRLHNIPAPVPSFTGRSAELAELLAASGSRAVILSNLRGTGGIGKTQLGLRLAAEWGARFPDAQLLLDGRAFTDTPATPASLLRDVILAFEPTASGLPDDVLALRPAFLNLLHGRRVLLFLDNATGAEQAAALVPPADSALIVTSRATFTVDGVGPYNVERMDSADALALLRGGHAALTDAEGADLIQLCDGLPKALAIAAAHLARDAARRSGQPRVAEYIEDLRTARLPTLDRGAQKDGLAPITATLQLSERALAAENAEAVRAWHALSVFPAPFDDAAAAAIAGAGAETLDLLLDASLLESDGPRYRLHDLTADYCRAALGPEALRDLRQAHARYFTSLAREADALYQKGHEHFFAGLALFDRIRPQVEGAFTWLASCAEADAAPHLIVLVNALAHASHLRFHPSQRLTWSTAQARAARLTGHRQAEGAAFGNMGLAHANLGDARFALACHKQSILINNETGNRRGEATAWGGLGIAYRNLGDTRRALECHEQHMLIAKETGDRRGEGQSWGNMGTVHAALNDARRALECCEQHMVIAKETGDRRGEGKAWGNMGNAHADLGDARRALECYEQCMLIHKETGDRLGEGTSWGNLGNAHADLSDARSALECYEQQRLVNKETGDRLGEGNALYNSADELWKLNAPGGRAEARRRMAAAAEIYEAIESPNAPRARALLAKWAAEAGE